MIQAIPLPRWLLLLILPWFTSAQNSALSPLKLFTLNPFFLCSNVPFWWEGKDADAPFTLYMARGNGPIGNNDSLSAEMFVSYTDDTNASPYLDESYANRGDIVKFRVEDNNGVSAVTWSVAESACNSSSTVLNTADDLTSSKPDPILSMTEDMMTGSPLPTSILRDQTMSSFPTVTSSTQGIAASSSDNSGYSGGNNGLSQGVSLAPQQTSENLPFTGEEGLTSDRGLLGAGETITHASAAGGRQTSQPSQPSQTVAPFNSSGESDTVSRQTTLSVQSIGAITGTIVIAILLWVTALVWRWRYRRRPLALKPREIPHSGSMRELFSPTSVVSNHVHHSIIAATSAPHQNRTQMQTPALTPATHGSPSIPSYNEAIGLHPPLNASPPFRNVLGVPRNLNTGFQLV